MSYTINPNAKNKWARNAENTMDLSLETDASSVYLDNGRTLEQEIGEGSMVSNVATVDSAMSKVIDGTLDGVYESGVMYGRSLVNLCRDSWWNGTLTNSYDIVQQLKPNTKYIILVNSVENIENISLATSKHSPIVYGECEDNAFNFITPSNTAELVKVRILLSESPSSEPFYEALLLEYQEGMENWDIPYFTGLCDVKMPILRNVGKNLFDINGDINQKFSYMAGGSGNVILGANSFRADSYSYDHHGKGVILNLKPNTTYTISGHVENFGNVNFMTGGWNPRHRIVKANGYFKTTYTPADGEVETCLSFVTFSKSSDPKAIFSDIQLEESSTPTTYEDHKTNILRTSKEIVLREVNGVCDTYNPLTGEYVQRIGEIVLDGSDDEIWYPSGLNQDLINAGRKNLVFYYNHKNNGTLANLKLSPYSEMSNIISDKLAQIAHEQQLATNTTYDFPSITGGNSVPELRIAIPVENSAAQQDSATCKAWLKENPIKVQYELAKPITTIIEPLTIPFAYQNGNVILESGYEGQSLLPTLEYSTVINKTGQIESVAKTIQRQEKQLTMLEKMLIQNIINLDYNNTLLTLKNEMEEML